MNNVAEIKIDNCLLCPYHFIRHLDTYNCACFCGITKETDEKRIKAYGERHKIVSCDDKGDLGHWTNVPEWCTFLC